MDSLRLLFNQAGGEKRRNKDGENKQASVYSCTGRESHRFGG